MMSKSLLEAMQKQSRRRKSEADAPGLLATSATDQTNLQPRMLPLDRLRPLEDQPRAAIAEDALWELLESMWLKDPPGPSESLVVSPNDDGTATILGGNRRYFAVLRHNELVDARDERVPERHRWRYITEVPVSVDAVRDPFLRFLRAFDLNERAVELNDIERAHAYHRFVTTVHPDLGRPMTIEEVATQIAHTNVDDVRDHLQLLLLPEPVQALVRTGALRFRTALALTGGGGADRLSDDEIVALAEMAAAMGWSLNEAREHARAQVAARQLAVLGTTPPPPPEQHVPAIAPRKGRPLAASSLTTMARQIDHLSELSSSLTPARLRDYYHAAHLLHMATLRLLDQLETCMHEQGVPIPDLET
jgi:ParB-like chromosome segregation protein Spo0J